MTADRAHALVTAGTSHQLLYVAATRGRHANHLWVATDTDPHHRLDHQLLPAPEQILAGVMRRRDPDRASAHKGARTRSSPRHDPDGSRVEVDVSALAMNVDPVKLERGSSTTS